MISPPRTRLLPSPVVSLPINYMVTAAPFDEDGINGVVHDASSSGMVSLSRSSSTIVARYSCEQSIWWHLICYSLFMTTSLLFFHINGRLQGWSLSSIFFPLWPHMIWSIGWHIRHYRQRVYRSLYKYSHMVSGGGVTTASSSVLSEADRRLQRAHGSIARWLTWYLLPTCLGLAAWDHNLLPFTIAMIPTLIICLAYIIDGITQCATQPLAVPLPCTNERSSAATSSDDDMSLSTMCCSKLTHMVQRYCCHDGADVSINVAQLTAQS